MEAFSCGRKPADRDDANVSEPRSGVSRAGLLSPLRGSPVYNLYQPTADAVGYLLPLLLALQLIVAWGFTQGLAHRRAGLRLASVGLLLSLLGAGFVSQLAIVSADSWWSKSFSAENAAFARLVNSTESTK